MNRGEDRYDDGGLVLITAIGATVCRRARTQNKEYRHYVGLGKGLAAGVK